MNIRFKNVHTKRYRALAFVLSLTVLLSGLVWYGVAQSNQKVEAVYPSREIVYVDTDFYDYYNDTMAENGGTGSAQGDLKRPFKYFNEAVSKYASEKSWKYPLYLGQFWRDTGGGPEDDKMYKDTTAKDQTSYNYTVKGDPDSGDKGLKLNNFVWAANLAFRPRTGEANDIGYSTSGSTPQFYAATQGLVDGSGEDSKGNLVPTCGGVKLPYFDEDFLTANYYINSSQPNGKIAKVYDNKSYPFYATDESVKIGTQYNDNSKVLEKFGPGYRFDSDVSGLYFDSSENLIATTNTITDIDGNLGFFPFNRTRSEDKSLNYCFGAKYTINFSMNENGTVDGKAWSNEHGTSDDNRAYFTFRGDDDVWVFIDDQLVLDMGGAHKKAEGYIDFTNKKSGVLFSANIADHVGSSSNLRVDGTAVKKSEKDLTSIFNDLNIADGKEHKLTMFYMERGMLNSNLFIQFNMPVDPHENMLTITDKVSVAGVNDGLKSQTLAIADSDAVKYTVSNSGTAASDVDVTGVQYPTYDYVRRMNTEYKEQLAMLSGKESTTMVDKDNIYLRVTGSLSTYIKDAEAKVYAWVWGGTIVGGKLVQCVEISNNLWKIPRVNGFTGFKILRLRGIPNKPTEYPDTLVWSQSNNASGNVADILRNNQNTWSLSEMGDQNSSKGTPTALASSASYKVEVKNTQDKKFLNVTEPDSANPGYNLVAQTNYELIDPKAQVRRGSAWRGFGTSSVAKQTDSNGTINMMYGQSAIFTGQFKPNSTMHIVQDNKLYEPSPRIAASQTLSGDNLVKFEKQNGDRTIKDYYTVAPPTLFYKNDPDGSNTGYATRDPSSGTDEFTFANQKNTTDKVNIEAIYTREVKTGSISVEKKLADGSKSTADEFTMKVAITDVFGSAGWSVDDYSGLVISGSNASTGNKVESGGTFKMKAGDTVTISGIPVDTVVTITESGTGTYWTQQEIKDNVGITVTEGADHKVTVTNERLTGKLILSKAFGSNVTDPTDQSQTFDFKVTLQSANGEEFDWNYWKDVIKVDNSSVNLTYVGDPMSNKATFEVTGITANASKTVEGIPYGVKYTVDEVVTPGWTKTKTEIEQDGTTDKKDSDVFNHDQETVTITNEKKVIQTGTLTINKALSGSGTSAYEDHDFPIKIRFNISSSITFDDLKNSNITYKVGSGPKQNLTIIEEGGFRVAWVKVSKNESVTVEGVPVGIKYNVYEEDVSEDYGKQVPELAGLKAGNWTNNVTSDNASHEFRSGTYKTWVDFEGDETITVTNTPNLGTLKISKKITDPQPGDDDIEFEAVVTLTLPDGYDPAVHEFTVTGKSGSVKLENPSGQKGTITITFSKGTPCTIRNVPIGTIWELTEKPQEGWTCEKVEYLTTKNQLTLDQGVMTTAGGEGLGGDPDNDTLWNPQNTGTLNKLKYNNGSSSSTTTTREIQVTNKRVAAYLTIEKYIDKLYYAENDNPHNFPASIGVGKKSPEDPHGYLGYTEAEQSFVFKVDKYDLNANLGQSPQPAPISTSYVVLKFDKDSTKITPVPDTTGTSYYYTDSTTVKVEPGFIYKVTELGVENGLGWRYDFASSAFATDDGDNIIATFNAAPFTSGANNGIEVKYKNTVKDLANATVTFYNKRNETDDKDIESDMSSIKNTIKVEKS